jgi:protein gp37
MEADWVRSIRDQCRSASVPFFFKQWGGVRKKKSGRELDGRTHDEVPARVDGQARPPSVSAVEGSG